MSFVKAITESEIEPGTGKEVDVEGKEIAILRDDAGNFYAMDKACPHAGFSMADGIIADGCVECFAHGALFDLETGEAQSPAHDPLQMYPVEVADGFVSVDLDV